MNWLYRSIVLVLRMSLFAVAGVLLPLAARGDEDFMSAGSLEHCYGLLTGFARECPTLLQIQAIETAEEIYQLTRGHQRESKTDADRARTGERVKALCRELRAQFAVLRVVRSEQGWAIEGSEPIPIARGVARHVWVDFENPAPDPIQIAAGILDGTDSRSLSIPAKDIRSLLLPILIRAQGPGDAWLDIVEAGSGRAFRLAILVTTVPCATIQGVLKDAESGLAVPGRVTVECADHVLRHGRAFADNPTLSEKPIVFRPAWYRLPFFYSDGHFSIDVPPGETIVSAERGFESETASQRLILLPGETRNVRLEIRRFVDMKAQGWIAGDTHIHWSANAWDQNEDLSLLSLVQRAEDLRVVNNLTLFQWRPKDSFTKPDQHPPGPVPGLCDGEYHIQMAEEYRNDTCYGHVNLLNIRTLITPLATGRGSGGGEGTPDYPLNRRALEACHAQSGIACEAHGFGPFENGDAPINAINGLVDCMDQLDPDYYYLLLNCGIHMPLGDGSDHPARPVGCARTYVLIEGPFSYEAWIQGIREDRTFVTSGPLLTLTVNGKPIGSILAVRPGDRLKVKAEVCSRRPVGNLQIVSNGEIVASTSTDRREAELSFTCAAEQSRWFVARCGPQDVFAPLRTAEDYYTARPDIAHTSAIYAEVDRQPAVQPEAVRTVVDRMRRHREEIRQRGVFAEDSQREEALAYVDEGIQQFERLLDEPKDAGAQP